MAYLLQQLTKTTSSFHWGKEQDESFTKPKQALADIVHRYWHTTAFLAAPIRLVVDASPWVLNSVATAASRFHIPTNCLWKPLTHRSWDEICTTRERIPRNRIWLRTLPPISVWKKLRARNWKPPTWRFFKERQIRPHQRWKMGSATSRVWLQIRVVYHPGKQNLADSPSCLPIKLPQSNMEACVDRYIH